MSRITRIKLWSILGYHFVAYAHDPRTGNRRCKACTRAWNMIQHKEAYEGKDALPDTAEMARPTNFRTGGYVGGDAELGPPPKVTTKTRPKASGE